MHFSGLLRYFILPCFILISVSAFAQKSSVTKTIDGKKYFIHTVEKNQSLYAISKIYETTLDQLCAENPNAIDGIKAGDELKIPVKGEAGITSTTPDDLEKYIIHKVDKKETIYGISKKYNLTEDQLRTLNPELKNGLKEGQLLKVGLKEQDVKQTTQAQTANYKGDSSYIWHTVKDGETFYSLARQYATTPEAIQKLNSSAPALKSGLKIRIKEKPLSEGAQNLISAYETQVGNSVVIKDTTRMGMRPKKQKYNIGLFLPVSTARLEMETLDYALENKKDFPRISGITADIYEGYLNAADSLKAADFEINTIVFDVNERDSSRLQAVIASPEFKTLDLAIGPLYAGSFQTTSMALRDLGIPSVSPTISHNKILFQNPLASKLLPSKNYMMECLAHYAADSLRMENIVIVNNDKPRDQAQIRAFKAAYNEYIKTRYNLVKDTLREVKGLSGVKSVYSDSKKNVVILLTENTVYLTEFLTQLGVFLGDKKEITLIGNASWMNIQNLDPGYFNRYNFISSVPYHLDQTDSLTRQLWNKYRDVYFSDPDEIYFQSFDLAYYYLGLLKKEGPDFWMKLNASPAKGTVCDFNFYSPDANTGSENRSCRILQVRDYKLVRINK